MQIENRREIDAESFEHVELELKEQLLSQVSWEINKAEKTSTATVRAIVK